MPVEINKQANDGRHLKLSVYLITKNEEQNLERALKSLVWADEIVILDSGSTDKTLNIAKKYGAKTVFQEFNNFVDQKNNAMNLCTGDWVFNVDADEEVSGELRKSIVSILSRPDQSSESVYAVCRKTKYLGRWMEHCGWYPEYRARLSKRNLARWTGEYVHEKLEGDGRTGRLKGDLLHRPYNDIRDHIRKIERYASLFAERELSKGRRAVISDFLFRPFVRFFKMYILKAGFLDGIPGAVACLMGGWYVCMKYARLYELSRNKS